MDDDETPSSENVLSPASKILPTNKEILRFLLKTLRHSCHFHYFAERLEIGNEDPEIPHDLVGDGNKLEWRVIRGLALQFRVRDKNYFENILQPIILSSRDIHRRQYHHRKWNGNTPNPDASKEDMEVGALDTICALLEPRVYNGGGHSYEQILRKIRTEFPEHKMEYCLKLLEKMRVIRQPNLNSVQGLFEFPNIGINESTHTNIQDVVMAGIGRLRDTSYYTGETCFRTSSRTRVLV